jgi:hypothetical protein
MPLYPSKCCELGSVCRLFPLPLSFTWIHIGVLQGVGNATFFILSQMCDGPYVWCYIFIVQNHPPCAEWLLDIIHNFVLPCIILFVSLMVGFVFLLSRPKPPHVVFLKLCWILLLICMLYVYHREVIVDMIVTYPVKWQCKCYSFNHDHEDAGIVAA